MSDTEDKPPLQIVPSIESFSAILKQREAEDRAETAAAKNKRPKQEKRQRPAWLKRVK